MSRAGMRARNHTQQVAKRGVLNDVDDRRTPLSFFAPLHAARGFTIDAAASAENALLPAYWTRETDALTQSWRGHRVWCNPPYSSIVSWVGKAWHEMRHGGCEHVTMLLPANRCEQGWWQEHIEQQRDGGGMLDSIRVTTRFIHRRLEFADSTGGRAGRRVPFGCVLVTWERAV